MTDHRFQAHATITPGEHELCPDGHRSPLVRVALSDGGPVCRPDGSTYARPDVVCALRPDQARKLAHELHRVADHAEDLGRR